ncbi:MAG: hypothetical protein WC934_02090 [Acidithiobacillus sp.]|jgi:hypothetical protein|uniref:hypothetical protein n=1 Tax=Acidithiobacillus sp. TaxID=1872118 RepID=UPI00355FBFF8
MRRKKEIKSHNKDISFINNESQFDSIIKFDCNEHKYQEAYNKLLKLKSKSLNSYQNINDYLNQLEPSDNKRERLQEVKNDIENDLEILSTIQDTLFQGCHFKKNK